MHVSLWMCQCLEPDHCLEGLRVHGASTQSECVMASRDQTGVGEVAWEPGMCASLRVRPLRAMAAGGARGPGQLPESARDLWSSVRPPVTGVHSRCDGV